MKARILTETIPLQSNWLVEKPCDYITAHVFERQLNALYTGQWAVYTCSNMSIENAIHFRKTWLQPNKKFVYFQMSLQKLKYEAFEFGTQ